MSIEAMNWALQQEAGSPSAKCVLLVLANRANPTTGECFPGIDGIADQADMSRRSVIRQIKQLETAGLLSVVHRGGTGEGRKSNVYKLHLGQSAKLAHRAKCQPVTSNVPNLQGQSDNVSPEPKDNPKKKPKKRAKSKTPDWSSVPNLNLEAWQRWMEDRKRRHLPKYKTTREAERLAVLPPEQQAACVDHSYDRYQGLFPDKFVKSRPDSDAESRVVYLK